MAKQYFSSSRSSSAAQALVRCAVLNLLSFTETERSSLTRTSAKDLWPDDHRDVDLLIRSESTPATLIGSNWANTLAASAVSDFLLNMGPSSAGSALLARGTQLQFRGNTSLVCPGLLSAAANTSFVGEGAPIPVRSLSIADGVTLSPKKFATICVFTFQVLSYSTPNLEQLVRLVLTESVGLALDSALLDTSAGDATRPAGLRNGIASLTPSDNTTPSEALAEDIRDLIKAVAPVSANAPVVFVAAPAQAAALKLYMYANGQPFEVLSTAGLADKTVVAIASNALVSAVEPVPRFDVSRESTIHLNDTPLQIGTTGTPPTVAAPSWNLFQMDSLGLRLRLDVAWGLRNSGGLSWMTAVTW